ncbi:MAG: hypothetical protein ACW99A_10885 [Candidatus Kariarchaeaceae archaeon]|jgi:hypothetical protein
MDSLQRHIKRFPQYIKNRLLTQKTIQLLEYIGLVIKPYYLVQEGLTFNRELYSGKEFKDIEFVELKQKDMNKLDRYDGRSITESILQNRIEQGHLCFALKDGSTITAFNWCNPVNIHHYKAFERPLNNREAYLYDAQTLYSFRGQNLAPYLRYNSYTILESMGYDVLFSCSDYFNRPAVRFKQKLNARFLAVGIDVEIAGLFKKSWIIKQMEDAKIADSNHYQQIEQQS